MPDTTETKSARKRVRRKAAASVGRPTTDTIKDHRIIFRVTAAEHFQIIDKAQRSGMSAGEYARSRTMRGIARQKKSSPVFEAFGMETRALLCELKKQGTNLNQIAHLCNRHQIPPPPEIVALTEVLQDLWRKVMS